VDGPFYADESLSQKEQRTALRNMVYNTMIERSRMNSCELVKYLKKDTEEAVSDSAEGTTTGEK
jgi:hypothetical protein